ncbi:MAG: NERD domain-containing protein [Treponema sp.]|nr:NERD domain-containing protein [Treponema sp.]
MEDIIMTEALTFEKVWAMFQETDKKFQETDRKMKETDRQISRLGSRFGELAEHLVAPNIKEKFRALNLKFEQVSLDHSIYDSNGRCLAEIDILLENGDTVMVVEVKSKPHHTDVDEHINRMEVLRRRADTRNDMRKFQGAIAGAIMSDSVRNYAHKAGFYVIEQTGDTAGSDEPEVRSDHSILPLSARPEGEPTVMINVPEGFTAREW